MTSSTDRIEKRLFLKAPQARVWQAISDAKEFGSWFGMDVDGQFVQGQNLTGRIAPTKADPEIAKMQAKYTGTPMALYVEKIEPMTTFSFRWHPFAIDRSVDYSNEPMTLVTFTLAPEKGGTMLTVVESGFDSIPIARRAEAFEANEEGWGMILQLIEKHLLQPKA
jgi:uncharacterized protein YndB with AHSA1/START domain